MELNKQVCTLEQAKRLKELGVDKPSIFSHVYHTDREPYISLTEYLVEIVGFGKKMDSYSLPAYTVAELGEMFGIGSRATEWLRNHKMQGHISILKMTDATWLADCLIEAIENGLIEMK